MTPLTRQDLIYTAQQLPKIDFLNHEEQVLTNYERGNWEKVMDYCLFVHQLDYSLRQNKTRRETLYFWIGKCVSKTRSFVTGLINRLRQTRYVGVVTGKDADRFMYNMDNPKHVSKEKNTAMRNNFNEIMKKAKL